MDVIVNTQTYRLAKKCCAVLSICTADLPTWMGAISWDREMGQKKSACKPIWGKKIAHANHFGAMTPSYANKRSQHIHTHVYNLLINATAFHMLML